jgi:hypothetical protein
VTHVWFQPWSARKNCVNLLYTHISYGTHSWVLDKHCFFHHRPNFFSSHMPLFFHSDSDLENFFYFALKLIHTSKNILKLYSILYFHVFVEDRLLNVFKRNKSKLPFHFSESQFHYFKNENNTILHADLWLLIRYVA